MLSNIEYYTILNPSGICIGLGRRRDIAWGKFFKKFPNMDNYGEGVKAYESIGYRCIQVSIRENIPEIKGN